MSLETVTSQAFSLRPHINPADLVIAKRGNEARYVPSLLIPLEIEGEIYQDQIEFRFTYSIPESEFTTKKFTGNDLVIHIGKYTGKIMYTAFSFELGDFDAFLRGIEQAKAAVKKLKAMTFRDSVRKSYDTIISFFDQVRAEFSEPGNKIKAFITSPPKA